MTKELDMKDELKKTMDFFDSQQIKMTSLIEVLEEIDTKPYLDRYVKIITHGLKTSKKDKDRLALLYLENNHPSFCKKMKEIDLFLYGYGLLVKEKLKKVEEIEIELSEFQDKKDELGQQIEDL